LIILTFCSLEHDQFACTLPETRTQNKLSKPIPSWLKYTYSFTLGIIIFQKKTVFDCETRFIYRTLQSAALRESFKTLSPSFILADRAARKFNLLSFYFYHARSPADMLQVEAHSTPQQCSLLTVHHKRTFVFSGRITC
jgi:hypothetical protein